KRFPDIYQLLSHQFYLDELYQRAFVYREKGEDTRTVAMTSSILHALAVFKTMVDRYLIDALVHWFAWFPQALGSIFTRIQNGQIQSYIRWITMGALVFLFYWYLWIAGFN